MDKRLKLRLHSMTPGQASLDHQNPNLHYSLVKIMETHGMNYVLNEYGNSHLRIKQYFKK